MTDTRNRLGENKQGRTVKGKYADEVFSYAHGVVAGLIIAGEDRVLGCQRFLDFCERDDLDIRTRDADFVIGIIEATFHHRQGEALDATPLRGQKLELEPWQKMCIYGMLIFYHKGTEKLLVNEAFIFIPRKNGKTLFVAALAWGLALLRKDSGAKVYVVGAALKQAMETFDSWKYNIGLLYPSDRKLAGAGWKVLDNSFEHSLTNENLGGGSVKMVALPSNPDGQDSFNANIVIADEMHAYKSPKQYTILQEATAAYTNKIVIGITTAGDDAQGFCAQRLDYCRKVLKGTIRDDAYFIFICCADKDENGDVDYTNPVQWQKANPSYGVTIRPGDMENDALKAMNDPQVRKDFLSKKMNVFVASMRSYFNIDEFRRSNARAEAALGIPEGVRRRGPFQAARPDGGFAARAVQGNRHHDSALLVPDYGGSGEGRQGQHSAVRLEGRRVAGDVQRADERPRPGCSVVHRDEADGVPDCPGGARPEILPGILHCDEKGRVHDCGPATVFLQKVGGVPAHREAGKERLPVLHGRGAL